MHKIFITPIIKKNNYGKLSIENNLDLINYFHKLNFLCTSSYSADKRLLFKICKNNDVLILSGGGNIANIEKTKENKIRDSFEKKLVELFVKQRKPIIAICRGFQLLVNLSKYPIGKISKHVRTIHKIKILKKNNFLNCNNLITNSYHEYGVRKLDKEYEILGITDDGSIELAFNKKKKILCFMFHPERKNKSSLEVKKIIVNFIKNFLK